MAFGRLNYVLLLVGVVIILIGYGLLAGKGSDETAFNPDIFNGVRTKVAPVVILLGFVWTIVAIMFRPRKAKGDGGTTD